MKRSCLLLFLLLVVMSSAMGQTPGPGIGIGVGMGGRIGEESWNRYTVKDAEFSVDLPGSPAMLTTKVARESDGKVRLKRLLKTTSTYYIIEAVENPEPKQSLNQFVDELRLIGAY